MAPADLRSEAPRPRCPVLSFVGSVGLAGGPAVAADGTIYIASQDGSLYALAAEGKNALAGGVA